MKNCLKKFRGVLAGCMVVVLLSTTAYGSGSDCGIQNDLESEGGMYTYCVATGKVTYTPPNETEVYSDETEGFSPGYNPFDDNEYDWGVIELDFNIGDKVGRLGLQYQSGSYTGAVKNCSRFSSKNHKKLLLPLEKFDKMLYNIDVWLASLDKCQISRLNLNKGEKL